MSEDERAIRSVIARWHDATAAGDVDSILELMSEDVVFLVGGSEPTRTSGLCQCLREAEQRDGAPLKHAPSPITQGFCCPHWPGDFMMPAFIVR